MISGFIHTYIHTYFIGSSPRGFSESILHYKIINQVHDNKNITMIKEMKRNDFPKQFSPSVMFCRAAAIRPVSKKFSTIHAANHLSMAALTPFS